MDATAIGRAADLLGDTNLLLFRHRQAMPVQFPYPLTPAGYLAMERAFILAMRKAWTGQVNKGLELIQATAAKHAPGGFNQDFIDNWLLPTLSKMTGEALVAGKEPKLEAALSWFSEAGVKFGKYEAGAQALKFASPVAGSAFKHLPELNDQDHRVVEWLQKDNVYWIGRNFDNNLRDQIRSKALEVASLGLSGRELGRQLKADLGTTFKRSEYYWEVVGSCSLTRGRTAGALFEYASEGYEVAVWVAMLDERMCFPAFTAVATDMGPMRIADIKIGQQVLSDCGGLHPAIATSKREYSGPLTLIVAGMNVLLGTSGHPIGTLSGWKNMGDLKPGDSAQLVQDQTANIGAVVNFTLSNMNDRPSLDIELRIPAGVLRCVLMPVVPINLNGNPMISDSKVNRMTANLELRNESDPEFIQRLSTDSLYAGLASVLAIACKAAEHNPGMGRSSSELLAASLANDQLGRTSACFGTEPPVESGACMGLENLTASFAGLILGFSKPAGHAADGIAVSNAGRNSEVLSADRTGFYNLIGLGREIAGLGTKATVRAAFAGDECIATMGTDSGGMLARGPSPTNSAASLAQSSSFWHEFLSTCYANGHWKTLLDELYKFALLRATTVHNLEVADSNTFYANGVVVHNCDICGKLDEQEFVIAKSLETWNTLLSSQTPEIAKQVMPWMGIDNKRQWTDSRGNSFPSAYFKDASGARVYVGENILKPDWLQGHGLGECPAHGGCRCHKRAGQSPE